MSGRGPNFDYNKRAEWERAYRKTDRYKQAKARWRRNNKTANYRWTRSWVEKNKKRVVDAQLKHRLKKDYGLTVEQYEEMLCAQDGRCAVCRKPDRVRLSVDHDHNNGKVRGLLCRKCNTALGLLGDDLPLVEALLNYVRGAV